MLSASIKELATKLKAGALSATEICDRCLKRIEALQELNAFITITHKEAKLQAEGSDARRKNGGSLGLLEGIPVAVKDNFSTVGTRTSCASRMLRDYHPTYNATMVQRLHDQGSVLMGKTNLDEYAMGCGSVDSIWGPVRNPWGYQFVSTTDRDMTGDMLPPRLDREQSASTAAQKRRLDAHPGGGSATTPVRDWRIAGGSSGGSAVAVATGTVWGALGSDTGGSTRNPAAYCGIVGLKPTYGLLSRHGLIPLVNSMDVPGIMARTVEDAAVMLNSLAGHDPRDSTTVTDAFRPVHLPDAPSVKQLHIGIPKEYHAPGTDPAVIDAWRRTADMFERAGSKVSEVSLPHTQLSIVCYHVLCCAEVASNMARYDGIEFGHRADVEESTEALFARTRHEGFNEVVRGRILAGNFFLLKQNYEKYFLQALKVRRLIAEDFRSVFEGGVDLLLTPSTLSEAPRYSQFSQADNRTRTQEQDVFTQPANMAGIPAIVVPTCLGPDGLPIGIQLMGQAYREDVLLTAAKWLQLQANFPALSLDHVA